MPGSESESTASEAVCGANTPESLAHFDPASSSWRTSQGCLFGGVVEFCATWPRSGTMRNGTCYPREPLALRTYANEFLCLPTVTANESKGAGKLRFKRSPHFRGAKMSEGLRTCESDPIYLSPWFAAIAMGFEAKWTGTATP